MSDEPGRVPSDPEFVTVQHEGVLHRRRRAVPGFRMDTHTMSPEEAQRQEDAQTEAGRVPTGEQPCACGRQGPADNEVTLYDYLGRHSREGCTPETAPARTGGVTAHGREIPSLALVRLTDQPGCADLDAVIFTGSEEDCEQAARSEPERDGYHTRIVPIERHIP